MKYSHLVISGIPKSFDLWESIDSLQPCYEGMNVDDIQYDAYPLECDEGKGEEACVLFDSSGLNVPPVAVSNVPSISESNVPPVAETNKECGFRR